MPETRSFRRNLQRSDARDIRLAAITTAQKLNRSRFELTGGQVRSAPSPAHSAPPKLAIELAHLRTSRNSNLKRQFHHRAPGIVGNTDHPAARRPAV